MEKLLIVAALISLVFAVIKMLEMKYVSKEWKPLKTVIRDAVVVFLASLSTIFVYLTTNGTMTDFFNIVTDNKTLNPSATEVFTGEPEF